MPQSNILPRARPETLGISPSSILAFLEAIESNRIGLHSFMLLRKGQVAAEAWWSPYRRERQHMLFSLSKSFTSTAIGLAVAEGRLSVDDDVLSFFPDRNAVQHVHLKSMRVKHLLSMSTGHALDAMGSLREHKDGDWVQAFLEAAVEYEPGTHFVYNSGASYMLSAIIQQITGQTLLDYLQPRLFEPLGIEDAVWETCPRGINAGGWGLSLVTEDIARFGQLYLQKGRWNGLQLLPEAWVEEATSFHISNIDNKEVDWKQGYGYQFWRCRHGAYRGDGAFGQFCVVMPEQEAVVAITSGVRSMQEVLNLVWEHLLPGMSEQQIPLDEGRQDALVQKIGSLAYPPLGSSVLSHTAKRVSGQRFKLEHNVENIQAASFKFEVDECIVTLWNDRGEHSVRCGLGRWVEGDTQITRQPSRMAASGMWLNSDTLQMEWRNVEAPFTDTVTCQFEEDEVNIQIVHQIQSGPLGEPIKVQGKRQVPETDL